jgi:hypothetical protein
MRDVVCVRKAARGAHQHPKMQARHKATVAVSASATVTSPYILTPRSDEYGNIVTIIVGPGAMNEEFHIHAGLLIHYSSYFRKALNPVWIEGCTKNIALSEDSPTVFQIFFRWIYSDELYSAPADGRVPISYLNICALYVFADAPGIPELCNAAVDVFFRKFTIEWGFPGMCLTYIYDNTLEGSNLRNIIVELAVRYFSFHNLASHQERFPKEFLVEVILRLRQLESGLNKPPNMALLEKQATEMCTYHDHKCPHDLDKTRSS